MAAETGIDRYRPSNGSEGADFIDRWCGKCKRDAEYREHEAGGCSIVAATMVFEVEDSDYPPEWTFDSTGAPCCTAFDAAFADDRIKDRRQTELCL